MMSVGKNALLSSFRLFNIHWLRRHAALPILMPYHHLVSDEPVPYIDPLYKYKNTAQFENDLDWLLRHFRPASLPDIVHQPPASPDSFVLCFDDGLRQAYEIALPILLRKGVPAALFVNPSFVGNSTIFHDIRKGWLLHILSQKPPRPSVISEACRLLHCPTPSAGNLRSAIYGIDYASKSVLDPLAGLLDVRWDEFARDHQPAMTIEEIRTWIAKGMAVGAHSMDHPLYSRIPLEEQLTQTIDSMDWVSDHLHIPYRVFAFPHVDAGVREDFFQSLFSASRPPHLVLGNSTGMREDRPHVLHRYIGENPARPAGTMVKSVLAYSAFRQLIGHPYVQRS